MYSATSGSSSGVYLWLVLCVLVTGAVLQLAKRARFSAGQTLAIL